MKYTREEKKTACQMAGIWALSFCTSLLVVQVTPLIVVVGLVLITGACIGYGVI